MLRHWEKLTLFLRQAGAPLDNNVCERALKQAILHRKNALFYKTQKGAHVGDLLMSLIYTCQLHEVNPFDYLTCVAEDQAPAADDLTSVIILAVPSWNTTENIESSPLTGSELAERHRAASAHTRSSSFSCAYQLGL